VASTAVMSVKRAVVNSVEVGLGNDDESVISAASEFSISPP
jgi:hypothetical protein